MHSVKRQIFKQNFVSAAATVMFFLCQLAALFDNGSCELVFLEVYRQAAG
jgi:hypothetical protein